MFDENLVQFVANLTWVSVVWTGSIAFPGMSILAPIQNVLNLIWKNPRIFPIWSQSDPLWCQNCHPWVTLVLDSTGDGDYPVVYDTFTGTQSMEPVGCLLHPRTLRCIFRSLFHLQTSWLLASVMGLSSLFHLQTLWVLPSLMGLSLFHLQTS